MANVIHAAAAAAAAAAATAETSTPDSVATADLSARPSDTCLGGSCAGTEKLCSEAEPTPPSTSPDSSPTLPEDDGTDAKYGAREEQSVQHKESAKKKRASKTAKQLKQSKLDIRREQFLAQVGLKAAPASHKQPAPNAKPSFSQETSPAPPASHHEILARPAPPSGSGLPGAGSRTGPEQDANGDAKTEGTAAVAAAAITAVGRKNGVIAHVVPSSASAVEASAVAGGNGLRAGLPVGSVAVDGGLQNTTAPKAVVTAVEWSSEGGAGDSVPTRESEAKKSSRKGDGTAKKVPGNSASVSSGPRDKQGLQDEQHRAGSDAPTASGVPAAATLQSLKSPTEQPGASTRKQQLQQCSAAGNGKPDAPNRSNEDDKEVVITGKKKNKRGSKAGTKAAEGKGNGSSNASGTKASVDEKQGGGQGVLERKGMDEGEAEDWEAVAEVLLELDEPKDRVKCASAKGGGSSSSSKLGSDEAVKANGHHDGTNGTAGNESAGSSDGEDASRPAALKHLHKRQQQEQLQQSLAPRQQQVKALHAATQTLLQKQQLLQQLQGKAADGDPILAPQRPRVQSSSGLDLYNVSRICSGGLRPEYTYTATVLSRSRSTSAHQDQRAWRPDDISRPPTLPPPMPPRMGLGSLGVSLANGLMAVGGGSGGWPSVTASDPLDGPWAHLNQHSQHHHHHHQFIHYRMQGESGTESPSGSEDSQPASFCPICAEELDTTDSSFVPCTCGFRLCLFCHHRIASEDGRCPGCRRSYSSSTMAAAAAAAVAAAAAPPASSGSGQKVTKPTSMWLKF